VNKKIKASKLTKSNQNCVYKSLENIDGICGERGGLGVYT
jgi:hypothetical protein